MVSVLAVSVSADKMLSAPGNYSTFLFSSPVMWGLAQGTPHNSCDFTNRKIDGGGWLTI